MNRKSFLKNLFIAPLAAVAVAHTVKAESKAKQPQCQLILMERNTLSELAKNKNVRSLPGYHTFFEEKDSTVYLDFTTGEWTEKRNK